MSQAQEQAAMAARKACIAWLRGSINASSDYHTALEASFRSFSGRTGVSSSLLYATYRTAWRATWETA